MIQKAPRQPTHTTSAARGALAMREPSTPTVAVSAEMVPKRSGGNQAAPSFIAPMKVTVAPAPMTKRPVKSTAEVSATAIASVPSPITALPAATTRRAPSASMRARPAA